MNHELPDETVKNLDVIAAILIRCFVITVGAMLFTWLVVFILGDVIFSIYSQLMEITRKEFDLFFLYTMTFLKALNILFFGIPFVAIKWYLRGNK